MPLDARGSWKPSAEMKAEGAEETPTAVLKQVRPWETTGIGALFVEAEAFLLLALSLAAYPGRDITGALGVGLWMLDEKTRKVLLATSGGIVWILLRTFRQLYARGIGTIKRSGWCFISWCWSTL